VPKALKLSGTCNFSRSSVKDMGKLHEKFNSQITKELAASQQYLSASIWCRERELEGMASYMLAESNEERAHALSLVDFATKREIPLKLEAVPAPDSEWSTPEELLSHLLKAEQQNTQSLYELADAAQACRDHSVTTFLLPFHTEQVDSENAMKTFLAKVKAVQLTPGLLSQLDSEIGKGVGAGSGA